MERLDELCLLQILVYLELPDQLSLLQCDERCYRLLGSLWRRHLTKIDLNLLQAPLSAEIFEFLLLSTHRELLKIRLNNLDRQHFDVLVQLRFPKLQTLQVDALPPFAICRQRQEQLKRIFIGFEDHEDQAPPTTMYGQTQLALQATN